MPFANVEQLVGDFNRFFTLRRLAGLLVFAAGTTIGLLWWSAEPYFSWRKPTYAFYAGPRGLEFERVGEYVRTRSAQQELPISITVMPTTGSLQNAQAIATTSRAIGLVGDVTAGTYGYAARKLQRIAPIFLQKAQLLYRKSRWQELLATSCKLALTGEPPTLRLSENLPPCVREAFGSMRTYAGPAGGGTALVASYLARSVGVSASNFQTDSDYEQAFDALSKGHVDAVFVFSAALERVEETLHGGTELALASIDPTLGAALRKNYGLDLVPTTTPAGHDAAGRSLSADTSGAYAWLAASPDVPPEHIAVVVRLLDDYLHEKRNRRIQGATARDHVVETSNLPQVVAALDEKKRDRVWEFSRKVVLMALFGFYLAGLTESRARREHYTRVYSALKEEVSSTGSDAARSSAAALDRLQVHALNLERSLRSIHDDFVKGRLSVKHREALTADFEALEKRLAYQCRFHLRKVSQYVRQDGVAELADRWFARGYIDQDEYERLLQPQLAPKLK